MSQNKNKCLLILKNFLLKMEIINERGDVNLNKWMEMVKDSLGLIKWGYRCV
jgi:hypothetical protein